MRGPAEPPRRRTRAVTCTALRALAAAAVTAAGLGAALLVGPGVGAAQAHDVLASTTPAAGATVGVLPDEVVLHFEEPAQALGTVVAVRGPAGDATDGRAELIDTDVVQPLRSGSPAGAYTVDWRVVSADGHVVQGTFAFTARAASTGTASPLPAAVRAYVPSAAGSSTPGVVRAAAVVGGLVVLAVLLAVLLRRRGTRPTRDDVEQDDPDDDRTAQGAQRADSPAGGSRSPEVRPGAVRDHITGPAGPAAGEATPQTPTPQSPPPPPSPPPSTQEGR